MVWHEKSSNVCGEGLQLALMANREFWSTYDPEDKSTAPTKHEVVSFYARVAHRKIWLKASTRC